MNKDRGLYKHQCWLLNFYKTLTLGKIRECGQGDLSVLFLTTACESTIITIKFEFKKRRHLDT